jgi:hypothetical protein
MIQNLMYPPDGNLNCMGYWEVPDLFNVVFPMCWSVSAATMKIVTSQ